MQTTSKFPVPDSGKRKALFLIDLQPGFVNSNTKIIRNIKSLIRSNTYNCYIEVVFSTSGNQIWREQMKWDFKLEESNNKVHKLLPKKKLLEVKKSTRSAFKGNKNIRKYLVKYKIKEIHIVGFDTDDCVFATAQESLDNGYFTYVIEECTSSSSGVKFKNYAIKIMRNLHMTNRSIL